MRLIQFLQVFRQIGCSHLDYSNTLVDWTHVHWTCWLLCYTTPKTRRLHSFPLERTREFEVGCCRPASRCGWSANASCSEGLASKDLLSWLGNRWSSFPLCDVRQTVKHTNDWCDFDLMISLCKAQFVSTPRPIATEAEAPATFLAMWTLRVTKHLRQSYCCTNVNM